MRDVMQNLMSELTMSAAEKCGLLPAMIFFKPTKEFLSFLDRQFPGIPIVDVGAGSGHLSKVIAALGRKVIAIDPFERESAEYQVYPFDATVFDYPHNSLPIMARPCRGLWVEDAIRQAMKTVPIMLYVGLRKNFEDDLYDLDKNFALVYHTFKAGRENERVVEIQRQ